MGVILCKPAERSNDLLQWPLGTKLCLAFEVLMAHGYILQEVAYKKKLKYLL